MGVVLSMVTLFPILTVAVSNHIILPYPVLYRCALSLYALSPYPPLLSLSRSLSPFLSHICTHTYTQPLLWSTGLLLMLHRPLTARCSVQLVKALQGSRGKAFTLVSAGAEMLLLLLLLTESQMPDGKSVSVCVFVCVLICLRTHQLE